MFLEHNKLYVFSSLTRGNWRNALYIECKSCPFGKNCTGHLLTTDTEGVPVIYPVTKFQDETSERIDKYECIGVISRHSFESLYNRWLLWKISDKKQCTLLQLTEKI